MLNKLIMLDPGHSGIPDPGTVGQAGTKESNVAWKIACAVRDVLMFRWGARVVLTKLSVNDENSDKLFTRYGKANNIDADLFVSIHLNGAESKGANGTETYHCPGSFAGVKLANRIQRQLIACLGLRDRGVKTARYSVLTHTKMPAALTEICFLTNPEEEQFINQPENIQKAAEAIAQGIVDYFYT